MDSDGSLEWTWALSRAESTARESNRLHGSRRLAVGALRAYDRDVPAGSGATTARVMSALNGATRPSVWSRWLGH